MENLETLAITIFEAGANALYQTIDENDGSCSNPKKYDELKQESVKVFLENTTPLIEKISSLEASLLDVTRKSCARVDELKDEIADLKSQLLISEQKVKLNYNCAIESSKSEATTNELELSVRIRQYIEKTHESDITPESLTKVFLDNYKPKSEANEAAYGYSTKRG